MRGREEVEKGEGFTLLTPRGTQELAQEAWDHPGAWKAATEPERTHVYSPATWPCETPQGPWDPPGLTSAALSLVSSCLRNDTYAHVHHSATSMASYLVKLTWSHSSKVMASYMVTHRVTTYTQ